MQITRSYESKSRWADIAKQIAKGNNGYLNIGDTIACTLKNGTEAVFEVLALDPYQQNSVVLGFRDLHWEMRVNEERRNTGGWRDCKMRTDFANTILPLLPDDLVEVIVPRRIVQRIAERNLSPRIRYGRRPIQKSLEQTEEPTRPVMLEMCSLSSSRIKRTALSSSTAM